MRTRRAMYKARAKELLRYGITPEEASVLVVVNTLGNKATPSEISRWLLREPHSTSELLKRMEKGGLVSRSKDLERKNMVRIAIKAKGRKLYKQVVIKQSIHRIMAFLSEKECRQLLGYMQKLRDAALDEIGIEHEKDFHLLK
ncbi:MarR family winged helix-turn-helix transcriptional regulator [Chloroflexota bacterium]